VSCTLEVTGPKNRLFRCGPHFNQQVGEDVCKAVWVILVRTKLERGVRRANPWWTFGEVRTELVAWPSRAVKTSRQSRRTADGSSLGNGYIGARTDTTQQTNICLGIHRRHVWLQLIRHACPYLQLHCNVTRILFALQQVSDQTVSSKQTHFVGAKQSVEITFRSYRFQCSRWHKQ